jgi:ribosomal protein S18 acetylase RimI-like enzyme/nitroimidazol reductase NimA-like FMN-containing flavoprotein (pyridoxamine 5'-phosphate oxidase superfamily)
MRKEIFRMDRAEALALLEGAPYVHLASTDREGAPILRTLHGVVVDGALAFHAAPAGEKTEAIGREAVIAAEETVASIPSYFVDPERACPATTLYRAAQIHGVLEAVLDPAAKARVLAALMAKLQPEGGHVPIDASHPLYRKAIDGILVVRVSLERVDGKAKLGQNRTPRERTRLLTCLWERGAPGDPAAIELIRRAAPDTPLPQFLEGPPGFELSCALEARDAAQAVELLTGQYWTEGLDRATLSRALLASDAWIGARDQDGALVGTARAVSDVSRRGFVYDVVVAPAARGRGIGIAMMRLLLAHPTLRACREIRLGTRDAMGLYAKLGFVTRGEAPQRGPAATEMVRAQG